MENTKDKKRAKILAIVWTASFSLFGAASCAWRVYSIWVTRSNALLYERPILLAALLYIGLYLYPLLYFVHHYAKRAEEKALRVVSLFFICFFSIFLLLAAILVPSAILSGAI